MMAVDYSTGKISGMNVHTAHKRMSDLEGIYQDAAAFKAKNPDEIVYDIQYFLPVAKGTEGGLFWGNTTVYPGKVGSEFYMTKGHFHAIRNRGEYYSTVLGEGALLLMNEKGETRWEPMSPGSLHYIPGNTAHRVANIGESPLTFLACWPADAGHDYGTILREGFSGCMFDLNGKPTLVERPLR